MECKEKIMKAALKLFVEIGFWEVAIKDILKEVNITKEEFNNYFSGKDQLICETIHENYFLEFNNIIKDNNGDHMCSRDKLFKIFKKYSEIESYLKNNFGVRRFNYESIICLVIKGKKEYELMSEYVVNFNKILLEKIMCIIEEGQKSGEILNTIDSKLIGRRIIKLLQDSTVLWAMNQNIDIKRLFETDFKYLWNSIKSSYR